MEPNSEWLHVRIPPTLAKAIKDTAEQRQQKMSEFARAALKTAVTTNDRRPEPRPGDARQTTARQ